MSKNLRNIGFAALAATALVGCATPPSDPAALAEYEKANDPLEPTNRYIFEVNRALDFLIIRPVADTYRLTAPEFLQDRVSDALTNMSEPITAINTLLQGRIDDTGTTLGRFLINTTVGLGGLFDVASEFGIEKQNADFGQTLYTWGFGSGPYLVMPIFGPSNVRDAFGFGVDAAADPVDIAFTVGDVTTASFGRTGASGVTQRAEAIEPLDNLESTSIDFYAQLRSIVQQRREAQLRGEDVDDFDYDIYRLD